MNDNSFGRDQEVNNDIPVVTAIITDERKNKRMETVLIVAAVIAVIAIVIAVAVAKGKRASVPTEELEPVMTEGVTDNPEDTDNSPVSFTEDVSISFEGISGSYADDLLEHAAMASTTVAFKPETTAAMSTTQKKTEKPKPQVSTTKYLEVTTVMTENEVQGKDSALEIIDSFFRRNYYLDGVMISGGEKTPVEMAMDGDSFQVYSEMDGQDIAIMQKDGDIFLMNPDTKKYTELNATIRKMMGITEDSFSFNFSNVHFDAKSPAAVTEAEHQGREAVRYSFESSEAAMDFIVVGDDVVQVILYDSDGEPETILELDEFTAGYPDDMLTFKGYSKTSMISFMSSIM